MANIMPISSVSNNMISVAVVNIYFRLAAKEITLDQLQLIPVRRNYRGVAESFKFSSSDDCTKYMVDSEKVLNVVHNWKYVSMQQ